MHLIEEMSMNAFPALQTILYDGWILRFADGYSNRANSVNPIYHPSIDIQRKFERCETLFRSRNLKPTYKITPFVQPMELDALLAMRGYTVIHPTSVQALSLGSISQTIDPMFHVAYELSEEWFDTYCHLNCLHGEHRAIYRRMLDNLVPARFFASLVLDRAIIACGMAVIEEEYIGLFDITVEEKYRNRGYGRQLIDNMLAIGITHGAKTAYLQVMLANKPAFHLYNKLGFKEIYQYHYRVLMD